MFLCSIYVQNLQQAVYVFCKFCVLYCLVLFTFIFNLFVTNESMYIVMMINKKQKNPTKIKMKQFILLMKTSYTRYKPDPIS